MEDERIIKNGIGLADDMAICGFPSEFKKGCNSPLGDTYFFDLTNPLQYDKTALKKAVEKLGVAYRVDMQFRETKETHYSIFVVNDDNITLSLYDCLSSTNWQKFIIGKDDKGDFVELDFDKSPHLLIAGTTGSGKSILLHNILINLSATHRARKCEYLIIDPKGSEFKAYKDKKAFNFCDSTSGAIQWLKTLENEMDRRYKLDDPMSDHDIFLIIDELADLMLTSKGEVETSLVRLAQKGRACGIHLIIATQYPKADVFSPLIRANIPYRICLKTATSIESIVVLGKKGAETLRGKGDCIVKMGLLEWHTQVAFPEIELEQHIIDRG